ncbi:Alanine/arginine aminopeptidase [Cladobotryum mycophilum]|uniref:Aminopeptidase n=1 Tax=Cladobotryum mycophilum TaxID=491253 RepID=A0ABR0S9P2_9HYPO
MPDVLPDNVKVKHYALSLRELEFKNWSYKGTVIIQSEIVKATKTIILNANELELSNAKVQIAGKSWESTKFSFDTKKQRATITFSSNIPVSKDASIAIEFSGTINDKMAGFYRSRYKPAPGTTPDPDTPHDDDWYYMFSTQFEAADARRAFPCFDEPNLKATYDFDIEIPNGLVALGNMPVKDTKPSKDGWKVVSFETSHPMSSYLVAWAVGDFEYIESFNKDKIPIRVYTTRGLKEQGQYALDNAPKILDFHADTFGIKYPLPKLDLVAVHEFSSGAMENWGLIVYRITDILYDEATSDVEFKNSVAYTVAHELAHQWFGNLVTMNWWDELWLNEGFATWAGWAAVNHLFPDWNVWPQFVNEGMEKAFRLDGIRASHPVHVDVESGTDADSVFDDISYLKGCSVIRMVADHVGTDKFILGVSQYLKSHEYGNATSKDLWDAIGNVSGEPISQITDAWITKVGHPVLTVKETAAGQISVRQTRFLSTGDVGPKDDTTTWQVPITFKSQKDVKRLTLTKKEDKISIDDDFYVLNSDSDGFYRINYPSSRLNKLATQLDRLSTEDRIALVGSTADLAFAGTLSTPVLLELLKSFKEEKHPLVWRQILNNLEAVQSVFGEDEEIRNGLKTFVANLIDGQMGDDIWDFDSKDTYLEQIFRKTLITGAVSFGHPKTLATAVEKYKAWVQDPQKNPINPCLRAAVWRAGLIDNPDDGVKVLKKEWSQTTTVDGKVLCLTALSTVEKTDLLTNDLLPFLFDGLADNYVARPLQWAYMQKNWDDQVTTKLSNAMLLERFIAQTLNCFTEESEIAVIDSFFTKSTAESFKRTLDTIKDKIRGRAYYKERDEEELKNWLRSNA